MSGGVVEAVSAGIATMADGSRAVMLLMERGEERRRLVMDPELARSLAGQLDHAAAAVELLNEKTA